MRRQLTSQDNGSRLDERSAKPLLAYGRRYLCQDGDAETTVQMDWSGQYTLAADGDGWRIKFYDALAY